MSATLGPSSEQTKGKLPVEDRVSPQASVSKLGLLCVISPPPTLLLLCHSHADVSQLSPRFQFGLNDSRPGPVTALCFFFPPGVQSCTVILLPPLPLSVSPPPLSPVATGTSPPLSRGEAGQESSGGRGRDRSGVSFLPTSSLSARIQSFEVTQPSQS